MSHGRHDSWNETLSVTGYGDSREAVLVDIERQAAMWFDEQRYHLLEVDVSAATFTWSGKTLLWKASARYVLGEA